MQPILPGIFIEVFKTNVQETVHAKKITALLLQHFPEAEIHFDLADCDHILRIAGTNFVAQQIEALVRKTGFQCTVLPD
jgi:hypothetical protein